jgi:hypothetical protein
MNYEVSWLIPDHVLSVILPETCTSTNMQALDADVISVLDAASHTIHVLVDLRPMKNYPSFDTSRKMKYFKHARMGELIVIGMTLSPALSFLGRLFGKSVGINFKDFPTPEDAQAYVYAMSQPQR